MSPRRAVFLDRDGTIIADPGFIRSVAMVEVLPGAIEAIHHLQAAGYLAIVVTNQSGLSRGLLTQPEYDQVATHLDDLLREGGVHLDATYMCPHHPAVTGPCECRKPGTLHYRMAAQRFGLDLGACWWIGDRLTDVEPAVQLGGRGILLGHRPPAPPFLTAPDLSAAAATILG